MIGRRCLSALATALVGLTSAGCAETAPPVAEEAASVSSHPAASEFAIVYSDAAGDGSALFGFDLNAGASTQLTAEMRIAEFPVWSPDGGRIAFLGATDDEAGVMALDANTGDVDLLIAELTEPVDFAPDGDALLFAAANDDGPTGLVALSLSDGSTTPLDTGSAADAYARWSVADNAIVLESARDGNPEIYRYDVTSGVSARLTDNDHLDEWPSPSPDGQWIAWAAGTEEDKNMWIMRSDGSEKRQLSQGVLFGDAFATWSPDGTQLLMSANEETGPALFLVEVADGTMTRLTAGTSAAWR